LCPRTKINNTQLEEEPTIVDVEPVGDFLSNNEGKMHGIQVIVT
jgi:hypothetical protein